MEVKSLLADAKARFDHNSAKAYLKQKYEAKLLIASQQGLWRADTPTIALLQSLTNKEVVVIDTFGNPVKVDRVQLLTDLLKLYAEVTDAWYTEWSNVDAR